jgi:hypothetical protein
MSTENEKQKAFNILSEMALFMDDTIQLADVEEQKEDLAILLRAFLVGNFADDPSTRNSILVITDQLTEFYNLLAKYTPDDVKDALLVISKLNTNVQKQNRPS